MPESTVPVRDAAPASRASTKSPEVVIASISQVTSTGKVAGRKKAAFLPSQNLNLYSSFLLIRKYEELFFFAISSTFLIKIFTSLSVPSNSTIKIASTSLGYPAFA